MKPLDEMTPEEVANLIEADRIIQKQAEEQRNAEMNRLLREAYVASKARPRRGERGPAGMVTRLQVDEARRALKESGKDSGERKIADHLGVSRDAVRYALGKDGRRGA
jgi:hypothetical protein